MSYKKEQFIEDFKNAYNQTQQLHYLYKYLKEYEGQIASVNVNKLEEETDNVAYYQFIFTLDNGNRIETDGIAFASYTFVDELDNKIISINNTITSLDNRVISINNTITSLDTRISNINNKMLTLPNTAPSTRKVVTINTNGAQDNVDGTELTTLMENIVDSHGNKRFVEGTFTNLSSIEVTEKYNKWSLCGTHLMNVIAILIPVGTFKLSQLLFKMTNYPDWLYNKLVTINATSPANWGRVGYEKGMICNNDFTAYPAETSPFEWYKGDFGNHGLGFYIHGVSNEDITITQEKVIRVQFDFIVDND